MSFTFNDALMQCVNDNVDAFDIAKAFVGDSNDKHVVFVRTFKKLTTGDDVQKAESAVVIAAKIYAKVV